MFKTFQLYAILLIALTLNACQTPLISPEYNGDVLEILGTEDDFTRHLSTFDYASKFKSEIPLSIEAIKSAYSEALEPYTDAEKVILDHAFKRLNSGLKNFIPESPTTIRVYSESIIEAGAAYTRGNAMCIPKNYLSSFSQDQVDRVVAHEYFHIVSRHNTHLQPDLYAILGYQKSKELVVPDQLVPYTIANPDAPVNNYIISCNYNGKKQNFMPIIYASGPYDLISDLGFFNYMFDDLLAVDLINGVPHAVLVDGLPLIVAKDDLEDFRTQIGQNTEYTIHPEETTADHFVMILYDNISDYPSAEPLLKLKALLFK